MSIHEKYMRMALQLAAKAEGMTSPNPLVGAVIVKDGKVIGRGYHKRCGLPHAEVNALNDAGRKELKRATLFVTLEPCDHFGRTPPCTDAIIESGIKKVVIGMKDPNPINNGKGIAKFKKHGIKTVSGVLEDEARSLNKPYIKFITKKMPYVTVKMAESLDGKIATRTGDSRWITSDDARRYVRELRGKADAVMVGASTVLRDDPLLLSKVFGRREPIRIVVCGRRNMPSRLRIFSDTGLSPVVMARAENGMVDLRELLRELAKMGIAHLLVEGGGSLVASLVEDRLVDRFLFFVAPKIIGGSLAPTSVEGKGVSNVREALMLKNVEIRKFEKDILIEAEAAECLPGS